MKDVSVFLRRFLLFVFYANISSTTSPFHLEGAKEPRTTPPVVKERWHGPSRTHPLHSEPIFERRRSVLLQGGVWLAMTSSSSKLTSRRQDIKLVDEDYQRDLGKVDGKDGDHEEEEGEDEERHSQTDRRHPHCRKRLDVDIESCLDGYERTLRNINTKEQLNDSFKLELCHEYEKTMQCLHLAFALCPPRHLHLQLVAYRLGYLRTFMEQTCDQLDNEDDEKQQEEKEEDGEDEEDGPRRSPSPPPPPSVITTLSADPASSEVTADRSQMALHEVGDATMRVISNVSATGLGSASTASILMPSNSSRSRTTIEPPNSTSLLPSLSNLFSSSSTTSGQTSSSSAITSMSSHLRVTEEHVTNRAGVGCDDALGCGGGREPDDADRHQHHHQQHRTSLRMRDSSSASSMIMASTSSRDPTRGGRTLAQPAAAATVAIIQRPFPSGSSSGETTDTGSLVTASSSVSGSKAAQCQPGVTCSRTNSAGNGNINESLDYNCLALSAIVILVRLLNICLWD